MEIRQNQADGPIKQRESVRQLDKIGKKSILNFSFY